MKGSTIAKAKRYSLVEMEGRNYNSARRRTKRLEVLNH
jgi:hypothetical protein